MWGKFAWLALAGAAGALARYWLSELTRTVFASAMPWGTWAVNVLGCFLFGLVWTLAGEKGFIPESVRFILLVGFMGAFTTFSTYVFELAVLWRAGMYLTLAFNFLGQNLLGVAALAGGMALGRFLLCLRVCP